ncbi:MAG: hypothetical protein QM753_21085 [Thermomicrobiales bacterium]
MLEGADGKQLITEMIDHQVDKATANFLDRNYGPMAFAAWVSMRLGTEFEAKEFNRSNFEQAESSARDIALQRSEMLINDWLEEHLNEDVEQKEWNWEALANVANSHYGAKLKSHDLKKAGRENVATLIYEKAKEMIGSVNLDQGKVFFDEEYGLQSLAVWSEQVLHLGLSVDDLKRDGVVDATYIAAKLKERAREFYDRKEIEFPVHCGLSRFLPDKAKNPQAVYDREGLLSWASKRFNAILDPEEFKNYSREQVFDRLVEASKRFLGTGKFRDEIDREVCKYIPDPTEPVAATKLEGLDQMV